MEAHARTELPTAKELRDAKVLQVSRWISEELIWRVRDDLDHPQTWVAVAENLNCIVYPHSGGNFVAYLIDRPGKVPVLVYNTSLAADEQVKGLVHEITHRMLQSDYPLPWHLCQEIRKGVTVSSHDIAACVESLVFSPRRAKARH